MPSTQRTNAPGQPRLPTSWIVAGAFLSLLLPAAMYLGYHRALQHLSDSFSRGLGQPAAVDELWADFSPALVVTGLRLDTPQTRFSAQRVVLELDLETPWKPRLQQIRLKAPSLTVRWPSPTARAVAPESAPPPKKASRGPNSTARANPKPQPARSIPLVVENGNFTANISFNNKELRVESSGIFWNKNGCPTRLILGPTEVFYNGKKLANWTSSSVEMGDPQEAWRLERLALVGGRLRWPTSAQAAPAPSLDRLLLSKTAQGYTLSLRGQPAGKASGQISLQVHLGSSLSWNALHEAHLTFAQADLSSWNHALAPQGLPLAMGQVDGTLNLDRRGREFQVRADLKGNGFWLDHPFLAAEAVGPWDGHLSLSAFADPRAGKVRLERVDISTGAVQARGSATLAHRHGRTQLTVHAQIPQVGCQDLLASLPANLAPALQGMALGGTMGFKADFSLDTRDLEQTLVRFSADPFSCEVIQDPPQANVAVLNQEEVVVPAPGQPDRRRRWILGPSNPRFLPLGDISRHLRTAFIVAEDADFYRHQGFDWHQVQRAVVTNLQGHMGLRGASTISQQLVKNVFLTHRRTLSRKFQEAVLTWRLEQVVPKDRIFEAYLNLVEMGPGIYGVAQAARQYFHRSASHVTRDQAARLAALTPSPRRLARHLQPHQSAKDGAASQWIERVELLLRLMRRADPRQLRAQRPQGRRVSLLTAR